MNPELKKFFNENKDFVIMILCQMCKDNKVQLDGFEEIAQWVDEDIKNQSVFLDGMMKLLELAKKEMSE
jgi:hypothetical protein